MISRFPLVLPNRHIQRMIDRDARLLILSRELPRGGRNQLRLYAVHNAKTERDNRRHRRAGRPDLQNDPHVLTIEPRSVVKCKLGEVDEKQARAAGFETVDEFLADWRQRRRGSDADQEVFVHEFEPSDARYLHRDIHRGYTHDPADGIMGAGAALSPVDLEQYAKEVRERDVLIRAAKRAEMPLEERIRDLNVRARNGSRDAQRALFAIRQSIERAERKSAQGAA